MKVKPPASNIEWEAWAQRDPLYAVATCPERDKDGTMPWSDEEFYALGKSDWEDFRARWELYGVERDSCVEIGCGAGRITRHMAEDFGTVHALDISEDMLNYAKRNVTAPNVEFRRTTGADLPVYDCTISGVFSCHVFQHFDSLDVARHYFFEIHRVLRDAGTFMIHVPICRWPDPSPVYGWWHQWQQRLDDWKARVNRQLIRAGIFRPLMRVLAYPIDWIFEELPKIGFDQVEIDIIALTSNGDPHAFVLARKAPPELKPRLAARVKCWRPARPAARSFR